MMYILHFASQVNFLDPKLTSDGKPYGPYRYKEIVKECYLISKNCNTSYVDLLKITPIERDYLYEFILEEYQKTEELIKKNDAERTNKISGMKSMR